jgi:hypothetical protein
MMMLASWKKVFGWVLRVNGASGGDVGVVVRMVGGYELTVAA